MDLIFIAIIIVAINFLGVLLLLIGTLFTYPFSLIAAAYVYRQLSGQTGVASQINPIAPAPAAPPAPFNPKIGFMKD